jgi:hypothetical protein
LGSLTFRFLQLAGRRHHIFQGEVQPVPAAAGHLVPLYGLRLAQR